MIDFHTDLTKLTKSTCYARACHPVRRHSAKPTTASLLRCSLRELREICVRQKVDYLIEIDKNI